jgi:hypothetical protein
LHRYHILASFQRSSQIPRTRKVAFNGNRIRNCPHLDSNNSVCDALASISSLSVSDIRTRSFCPAANFKCSSLDARSSRWRFWLCAHDACVWCALQRHTHTREREPRPLSVKHFLMDTKCDVCVHLFDAETPHLSDVRLYPWSAPSPLGEERTCCVIFFSSWKEQNIYSISYSSHKNSQFISWGSAHKFSNAI